MTRVLPPLPAVRAFEAAARHGSFVGAGDELCVSPGAIGHQVRLLEDWLGRPLFVRRPRAVELNEAGRRYLQGVGAVLDELERLSAALRHAGDDHALTVTALPSFITRWLMPRLGGFRARHPQVDLRLLASIPPVDFARDQVDLALRLGRGLYPGLAAEPLLPETYVAVGGPTLGASLGAPADVLSATLLHDDPEPRIPEQVDWPRWCAAQQLRVPARRLRQGLRFSHTYLTLDAAAAGEGAALASDVLAADALAQGRLALLPGRPVPGPYAYHLVHPQDALERPAARAFCEWLRQEATQFREEAAALAS